MQIVCPECSNELKQEESDIVTPTKIYKYQCNNCYFVSNGTKIYNINNNCSLCLNFNENKTVLKCGHWYCQNCSFKYKSDVCLLCNVNYSEYIEYKQNIKGNKHNINIPDEFKKSFQKLYKRLFNKIDKYIMLNYTCHEKTIVLLEEYYKWLLILSKYRETEKLSPGSLIDLAWHEHILDIQDYIDVCNKINGKLLPHYPEDSFDPFLSKRISQISSTHSIYNKIYGKMLDELVHIYWKQWTTGKVYQQYYSIKTHKQLFVKDLSGVTITLPFANNTTVEEIKLMIFDFNNASPCDQRLLFSGKQLEDGLSLVQHYKIKDQSTLQLVLRLRGC